MNLKMEEEFCICGDPLDLLARLDGGRCMNCVRARAAAAAKHLCVCPKRKQEPVEKSSINRRWISCERCLGTIKQLS